MKRGKVDEYIAFLKDHGIRLIEISDGVHRAPARRRSCATSSAWRKRVPRALRGRQQGRRRWWSRRTRWVKQIKDELEAGAWKVITEGRESGTVGLYRGSGEIRTGLIDEIETQIDTARLMFEAPQKAQQVWLVKHFGPNVNLGNIPPAGGHLARDHPPGAARRHHADAQRQRLRRPFRCDRWFLVAGRWFQRVVAPSRCRPRQRPATSDRNPRPASDRARLRNPAIVPNPGTAGVGLIHALQPRRRRHHHRRAHLAAAARALLALSASGTSPTAPPRRDARRVPAARSAEQFDGKGVLFPGHRRRPRSRSSLAQDGSPRATTCRRRRTSAPTSSPRTGSTTSPRRVGVPIPRLDALRRRRATPDLAGLPLPAHHQAVVAHRGGRRPRLPPAAS